MKLTVFLSFIFIAFYRAQAKFFLQKTLLNYLKTKLLIWVDYGIPETKCATELKLLINDLFEQKPWAITMFDAYSKIHPGISQGNAHHYGNSNQCQFIQHSFSEGNFTSKYCTAYVRPNDDFLKMGLEFAKDFQLGSSERAQKSDSFLGHFKGYYGACVPKSCSAENLNGLYKFINKEIPLPFRLQFTEDLCQDKDKPVSYNQIDIYIFFFFSIILLVEAMSTVYDLYLRRNNDKPGVIVCFSLYANIKKLLSTHTRNDALTCLHGIKVLSIAWIVYGHFVTFKILLKSKNGMYIVTEWMKNVENTFISAAPYSVDTFFTASGILVIYVYMTYSEKIKITWLMFYLHRLVRLIPALLAAVLINISLVKYLTEKQQFSYNILHFLKNHCEKCWWATLFFVANRINPNKKCIHSAWYLAVDTQLYALCPLFFIFFKKLEKKIFWGIFVICTPIFIYTWTVVVKNNYGFILFWEILGNDAVDTYLSTIFRMPTFLIGMCCGYLLYCHNFNKIQISNRTNLTLWLISLSTMFGFILYQNTFFREQYSAYRSAFFNTFSRPLWSLCICYIIFSCSTGHGGIVNSFLSHSVFKIFGKLTYCIFLIHETVIHTLMIHEKQFTHFANLDAFCDIWSHFIVVIVCAVALNLMFEVPLISLLEYLEKRGDVKNARKSSLHQVKLKRNFVEMRERSIVKKRSI